jgi:uracil-DNA glycosylase
MLDDPHSVQSDLIASTLDWWVDVGVDTLVEEVPREWLAPPAEKLASANNTAPVRDAGSSNHTVASLPNTLLAFTDWLITSPDIPNAGPQAQRVRPLGDFSAGLMIMVDMPDVGDAAAGHLLSGEAGALFDKMLQAIGKDRETVYLCALSPGRTPGGQIGADTLETLTAAALHHIALVKPDKLWLMGQSVSRAILGADAAPGHGRLRIFNHDGRNMDAVASFAPRFLLQQPKWKAGAWADMQALMKGKDA